MQRGGTVSDVADACAHRAAAAAAAQHQQERDEAGGGHCNRSKEYALFSASLFFMLPIHVLKQFLRSSMPLLPHQGGLGNVARKSLGGVSPCTVPNISNIAELI